MTIRSRVLAACAVLLLSSPARNLDAVTFSANLGSIKLYARPGQVHTRQFQLTLDRDQPRTAFKAHAEDWWRSEDGKQSFYAESGTLRRSCGPWVSLNPVEAAVDPGKTLTIRVTVTIPADAKPGGYWCVFTIDEVPDPLAVSEGVDVKFVASASNGIFVYIDPVDRAARITDVRIDETHAFVRLRNEGNAPLAIEGRIEFLRPGETRPVASVALPRETLLPEPIGTGLFGAPLPTLEALPSGRYLVRALVDIGLDHFIGVQREMVLERDAVKGRAP